MNGTLKDFIERLSGKEVNKRTIESFIKSGAFDSLGGTRKQFMVIYLQVMDQVNRERKYSMTGQMSLFDMVSDDQKAEFDIPLPNVGEYEKETKLAFEKEVLGIYLSGLEFQLDEETGRAKVHDGAKETVGGMITAKTIKYTKNNKVMAFLTLEDLAGSVEVIVFPKDYEKNQQYLEEESKVFIRGRVSEEDEADSKLICETVIPFEQTRKELWLQYPDKAAYLAGEQELFAMLADAEGDDTVIIYCRKEKAVKKLPPGRNVKADKVLLSRLTNYLGEACVKLIEKPIENRL